MKKKTITIGALLLAMTSFSQTDSTLVTIEALKAKEIHKNLYYIVSNAEDMMFQLQADLDSGFIFDGMGEFYKDLLKEIIDLSTSIKLEE